MATAAYAVLLLVVLVLLGRPTPPLTARAVPGAALRGALVLSRLSDRRRERATPAPVADHALRARGSRSAGPRERATSA